MTTLDHPDIILSDKRDHIMQAVREVIDADAERARRQREHDAAVAVKEHLPHISAFIESYGTDPTNGMVSGPCTDAGHALAWVTTAAGFHFEIVESHRTFIGSECWLLHPMTAERVYRIDCQATWENAARAIHAADERTVEPLAEGPDADHPAEVLVDALRAFIDSITEHHGLGGF